VRPGHWNPSLGYVLKIEVKAFAAPASCVAKPAIRTTSTVQLPIYVSFGHPSELLQIVVPVHILTKIFAAHMCHRQCIPPSRSRPCGGQQYGTRPPNRAAARGRASACLWPDAARACSSGTVVCCAVCH
jgi:hypothetical protein